MQIHFCGTLCHLMSHFSAKQSLWADLGDGKWQFCDRDDSWWYKPSSDGSLDPTRWEKNEQTREQLVSGRLICGLREEDVRAVRLFGQAGKHTHTHTSADWSGNSPPPSRRSPDIKQSEPRVQRGTLAAVFWGRGLCTLRWPWGSLGFHQGGQPLSTSLLLPARLSAIHHV